jgi:hypothetical protein
MIIAFFLLPGADVQTFMGVYAVRRFAVCMLKDRRQLRQNCQVFEALRAALRLQPLLSGVGEFASLYHGTCPQPGGRYSQKAFIILYHCLRDGDKP